MKVEKTNDSKEETQLEEMEEKVSEVASNDKKKKKEKKENLEDLQEQLASLETENNSLKETNKLLEETILREKAEAINYRKRKDEETAKKLQYANEDLVKEILPSLDNLERAIQMDDDNLEDEVSKFLSGIKMIYCHMVETLEKYGVKAIDGSQKPFDGVYHQAVLTEHVEGVEAGMVIEVLQKGYLLQDKVIRHAMVKVSE